MIREIVRIDEEKCDGCGQCVPACHEGAIAIVGGKAKLTSDRLCDGLGDCLGECPQDAITIERREAEDFDESLVALNKVLAGQAAPVPAGAPPIHGGCPGSRQMRFERPVPEAAAASDAASSPSELTHWPVQIMLMPPNAPVLRGSRLLVAADCVPFAYPDFHAKILRGRTLMVGCPKLDNLDFYVEKLTEVMRINELQEVCVARMEVPCCTGILQAVLEARQRAGVDLKVIEVVISTRGDILAEREHSIESAA